MKIVSLWCNAMLYAMRGNFSEILRFNGCNSWKNRMRENFYEVGKFLESVLKCFSI